MTKLLEKFGEVKQWTNWRYEMVKGKMTKVPYMPNQRHSASNNPKTWSTYDEVDTAFNNGSNRFSGVGLFFKDDGSILGIDIDHCLEDGKIVHEQKEIIESLLKSANTYTEISPSKTGLHLFFIMPEKIELVANRKKPFPFEVYNDVRYLTVTNNAYFDIEVRTVTPEEMLSILSIIGYPWGATKKKDEQSTVGTIENLTDEDITSKMFRSKKNGAKVKALYDGDVSQHNNDKSSADMSLCMHLAYWSGKNASQMERIWLASPLGQREKTKERKDYRKRTIDSAIAKCDKVYESSAMKIKRENPELDLLFVFDKQGDKITVQNTENICRILRTHDNFKDRFRHDSFKNILEIKPTKTNIWRQIEDNDAVNIQTGISILFSCFSKVGKEMVYDAIIKVAKENTFDSAISYITSLQWDKVYRLDTWLSKVYGTPEDKYHIAVGSNWIKGMVKRLVDPGCKFDFVLVLEGEQGVKKSTSLYVLGGEWHTETAMSTDSKDFFMQFSGKSIIEFSEGETLSRTEVKRMKAIITMQYDRFRLPYERSTMDFPRRCVFAMTTNQSEYLKDETGNRRWLPVRVLLPEANIEWLKENREQLLAEAYHRITVKKETIYEFPLEETRNEQQARRMQDPYTDSVVNWYYNVLKKSDRENGITIFQVYQQVYRGGSTFGSQMAKWEEMSIANLLKDSMKLEKRKVMRDGVRSVRWYNPNEEVEMTNEQMVESILVKGNF